MPRTYTVSFENVAVSAVQDLIGIYGAAGKMLRILEVGWKCSNQTLAAAQQIRTRCSYLPATVTSGSVGSASTPRKDDDGDSAASFTARINDTTQATSSGTKVTDYVSGDYLSSGLEKTFIRPKYVGPTDAFVFELLAAPSGTVNLSCYVVVEESGGAA